MKTTKTILAAALLIAAFAIAPLHADNRTIWGWSETAGVSLAFPAAYTPGCQIEAHLFAEASDEFKAQKATVIGVTAGKTDQLEKFSTDTQYCSGKFAMAADTDLKIAASYKSLMAERPLSDRTSYVIGKDHKIALVYSNANPNDHVTQTLGAVKKLSK